MLRVAYNPTLLQNNTIQHLQLQYNTAQAIEIQQYNTIQLKLLLKELKLNKSKYMYVARVTGIAPTLLQQYKHDTIQQLHLHYNTTQYNTLKLKS